MDGSINLSEKRTYVLYTVSGSEHKVLGAIKNYLLLPDEEAYSPLVERVKRIHGVDREIQANLYPGYIFIETGDPAGFLGRIKVLKDEVIFQYIKVLRNHDYILPIEPEEEKMLRELCGDNHICDLSRGYIEGDQVVITEGPLRNFTGEIQYINRHKKMARIVTYLLNREIDVTVGLEILKKI